MKTWTDLELEVRRIANGLPIYWGTGNTVYHPHVVAWSMDAWSGGRMGYNVAVYPEGGGYGKPSKGYCIGMEREA